jgi:hypothetical protein
MNKEKKVPENWVSIDDTANRVQEGWTSDDLIYFMMDRKIMRTGNELDDEIFPSLHEESFILKKVKVGKRGATFKLGFPEVFVQFLIDTFNKMMDENTKSEWVYSECLPIMDEYDKNIELLDSLRLSLKKDYDQKIAEIERKAYEKTA